MAETKPLASLSSGLLARKGAARPAMRRQNMLGANSVPASSSQEDLGWNDMGYDVDPPKTPEPVAINGDDTSDAGRKEKLLAAAIPEVVKQQDELQESFSNLPGAVEQDNDKHTDEVREDEAKPEAPSENTVQTDDHVGKPLYQGRSPLLKKRPSKTLTEEQECSAAPEVFAEKKPALSPLEEEAKGSGVSEVAAKLPKNSKKPRGAAKTQKRAAFTLRLDPERHLKLRLACAIRNQSAQLMVTEAVDQFLAEIPELDAVAGKLPAPNDKKR